MGDPQLIKNGIIDEGCEKLMKRIVVGCLLILSVVLAYLLAPNAAGMNNEKNTNTKNSVNYSPRYVQTIDVKNYNIVGYKKDLYERMPQRVIAVGENINETLIALGVADKIICSIKYGNLYYKPEMEYAEKYKKLHFEQGMILNTETILSMNPDLIVSGQSLFTQKGLKSTDFWNERKIHTFLAFNANKPASRNQTESLDLEYKFILGLGDIFDQRPRADEVVAQMQNTIDKAKERTKSKPKQKVMIIERLGKNIVTYDSTKLAGDICTKLGAYVPDNPTGTVGLEELIKENPDVIFVVKSGGDPEEAADIFRNMPSLQSLKAVKNKRVYGIALNYTYNSAIKTGVGIKKFADGIYPGWEKAEM